jgi:hypothetical protein
VVPRLPVTGVRTSLYMKLEKVGPSSISRFRVRTASVDSHASASRGYEPNGRPTDGSAFM